MKKAIFLLIFVSLCFLSGKKVDHLKGFTVNKYGEQHLEMIDAFPDVRIIINAPSPQDFDITKKTAVVLYALPNGNSIEWTAGKLMEEGDDWHYNIQNIGAQIRFVRNKNKDYNWVVAYLEAGKKSWPAWVREHNNSKQVIQQIVDSVRNVFLDYQPVMMLNGHSGGGRFILDYIAGVTEIPADVERIAFLDSNYGYVDSLHLTKIVDWLQASDNHYLDVLAYNDSVVIYNGKPLVSSTGGTWYRSRAMQRDLSGSFDFKTVSDTAMIHHTALDGRIQFRLKENPNGLIYHTVLVELNGFIFSLLAGTEYENEDYTFWGDRAYNQYQTIYTDY